MDPVEIFRGHHISNFEKKIREITDYWINAKIDAMNTERGREHYVGIHKYGVRVSTRKSTDEYGQVIERHIKQYRWDHWRESVRTNMLHLTNERRFVLSRAINEYFIHRT